MITRSEVELFPLGDEPEVLAANNRKRTDERSWRNECKYCGQPIVWGQIIEILGQCDDKVGQWIPLDPDEMQHECRCRVKAAATEEDSA